jgi:hypothetical protein
MIREDLHSEFAGNMIERARELPATGITGVQRRMHAASKGHADKERPENEQI